MNLASYKDHLQGKTFMFFIGHYYHLGGAEAAAIILAKELQKRFEAHIIFLAGSQLGKVRNELESYGFKTLYFPFDYKATPIRKLPSYVKLIRLLRKVKPDFLLPYVAGNNKMVLPIWKYTGAKYAWWMQQDEGRDLYKTKFEKWCLSRATAIISNSEVGMDFIAESYGIDKKSMVHYNNLIYIPDADKLESYWRTKLQISSNDLVVSMIANITPFKDHATLFKAWAKVVEYFNSKGQKTHLLLAGQPKEETLASLKILGFDLNLSPSVHFLGSTTNTNELIKESNLMVHSSLTEGCPNAVCEAMALGKAVVGTDIPGNSEALTRTYQNVCLAAPQNPEDLAVKIIHLLENEALRKKIDAFNANRIIEHYNVEQMLEKICKSLAQP